MESIKFKKKISRGILNYIYKMIYREKLLDTKGDFKFGGEKHNKQIGIN